MRDLAAQARDTRVTPPNAAGEPRSTSCAAPGPGPVAIVDLTEGGQLARRRARVADGVDFLRARLAEGSAPTVAVKRDARAAGISERTLRRAQRRLRVRAIKVGRHHWEWCRPEDHQLEGAQSEGDVEKLLVRFGWKEPDAGRAHFRHCRGTRFWRRIEGGDWKCEHCHPPPAEDLVGMRIDVANRLAELGGGRS